MIVQLGELALGLLVVTGSLCIVLLGELASFV